MRIKAIILAAMLTAVPVSQVVAAPPVPPQIVALVKTLKPEQGKVAVPAAKATLNLGTSYDFYDPEEARKILVEIWGNPPTAAEGVLGLVLPAGKGPLTDTWGAVITFEDTGHVSDDDAVEVDYSDLLSQMKDGQADANAERKSSGYPEIDLIGWAQQPAYNKATHSVIWARDLKFADSPAHTLNYDVRTLGRTGVLSLNLISSMDKLEEVKAAAGTFAAHASFDPGAAYADFDPATDRAAEFGIGGLVAAGAGVAVAKKLGIFAILAKFAKPILFGVFALFAAFRNKVAALFGRNKDRLEGE